MSHHTLTHRPYSYPFGFFATANVVVAIFFIFGIPASLMLVAEKGPEAYLLLAGCIYGLFYLAQQSFFAPLVDQIVGSRQVTGIVKSKNLFQTSRYGLERVVLDPLENSMGQPTARYWFKLEPNSRPYRVSQEMYYAVEVGKEVTVTYTGFSRIVTQLELAGPLPKDTRSPEQKTMNQAQASFKHTELKLLKYIFILFAGLTVLGMFIGVLSFGVFLLNT